jgi:hypothetical protein
LVEVLVLEVEQEALVWAVASPLEDNSAAPILPDRSVSQATTLYINN